MEINLHLPEVSFSDRPTKTQLTNALNDHINFWNKIAGSLLASGDYAVTDQSLATLLNATVQFKAAKDLFDGVSTAGMAAPNPNVSQMQRRG
jgi:hypothetical protein